MFESWYFISIFENLFTFFSCLFTIFWWKYHLSNTFWLYQHRVKYEQIRSYSSLLLFFSNESPCRCNKRSYLHWFFALRYNTISDFRLAGLVIALIKSNSFHKKRNIHNLAHNTKIAIILPFLAKEKIRSLKHYTVV